MTETQNILQTLAKRLGDKQVSIVKDEAAIDNLEKQIALYQKSIDTKRAEIDRKALEVSFISGLMGEAEDLVKRHTGLVAYTTALVEKFNQVEWKPDMKWEEKLESTDYSEKVKEKFDIEDRLKEILKQVNKAYFRR